MQGPNNNNALVPMSSRQMGEHAGRQSRDGLEVIGNQQRASMMAISDAIQPDDLPVDSLFVSPLVKYNQKISALDRIGPEAPDRLGYYKVNKNDN